MKLFHNSLMDKETLLREGLKGAYNTAPTYTINKALKEAGFTDIADIRGNSVFLLNTNIRESRTVVSIDTMDIDTSRLYVADEVIANKIFSLAVIGRVTGEYAKLYADSFMSYDEYLDKKPFINRPFIKRPEFIYLGDISADKLTVEKEGSNSTEGTKIYINKSMEDYIIAK